MFLKASQRRRALKAQWHHLEVKLNMTRSEVSISNTSYTTDCKSRGTTVEFSMGSKQVLGSFKCWFIKHVTVN